MTRSTFALLILAVACSGPAVKPTGNPSLSFPGEKRITNLRQLTDGGTNAEAYWSFDGRWLTFQHKGEGVPCDQIFTMRADGSERFRISNGKGRTTCAFYLPDDSRVLYSTTAATAEACPAEPDRSRGYVWPIYNSYQIYAARPDSSKGRDPIPLEPGAPRAYNAEATVCHDGSVIFTSDRDGDLELYRARLETSSGPNGVFTDIKRLTREAGYDGGAFFSPDCSKIVWRASRPKPGKELDDYRALLKKHLVRPGKLELWVADADGSKARQITRLGAASFAPYFTPDQKHVVFSSNPRDPQGRKFDLYQVGLDGTGLEQLTFSDTFDSFPMFSPDGKHLAFSSNRNARQPRETNVFVADWTDLPPRALTMDDADASDRFMATVRALSAPEMQGRGLESEGLLRAERLVAERFEKLGLKPYGKLRSDERVEIERHNVVGTLGEGCGRVSPIVIGAHLDGLGLGNESASIDPVRGKVHPSADDNASGVAAVIEVARLIDIHLRQNRALSARSCYVFAAFIGEESGVIGSSRLFDLMNKERAKPKAMLNLDRVGRLENNRLLVFGIESAKEWETLTLRECAEHSLACSGKGDGYGPSDHLPFYLAKVPVLHFFTGSHEDYHRSSDTSEKINATGGVQVAEVVAAIGLRVGSPSQLLRFQKSSGTPSMGPVAAAGVLPGSPAAKGNRLEQNHVAF